jgi:hypothetical protein
MSFAAPTGGVGPYERSFRMRLREQHWRYVGRSRFVPPWEADDSPTFVEWRREGTKWVVSSFGDEYQVGPPVRPFGLNRVRRGLASDTSVVVKDESWYAAHEPIFLEGRYYMKFGRLAVLLDDEVTYFGALDGAPVYVEADADPRVPDVLYVQVSTGSYQPYYGGPAGPC